MTERPSTREELLERISDLEQRLAHCESDLKSRSEDRRVQDLMLHALLENTEDGILFSDEQAVPIAFNSSYAKAMKDLLGLDMKPGVLPHAHLKDEAARAFWEDAHRRALAGEQFRVEFSLPAPGAGGFTFEHSFNPIIKDGRVIGFSEFTRDISERKRMEHELRISEQRYRLIAENSGDMISRTDAQGRYTFVSPAVRTVHGYEPEDLIGRTPAELIHPDDLPVAALARQRMIDSHGPATCEYRYRRPDGSYHWVESTGKAYIHPHTNTFEGGVVITRSIDMRKRMERELRDSESRARALLDSPFTSAVLIDLEGIILDLNSVAAAAAGRPREELINRCVYDFLPPDVAAKRRARISEVVETRAPVQYEDWTPSRVLEARLFPLFDDQGRVFQVAALGHDITDRIRAQKEKETLLEQLYQSQKMEAVGRLAGGIAHDFNNILAAMMGGAEAALRRMAQDDPHRIRLERILKAGGRGRGLTMKLLAFARREKLDVQTVPVARLVEDILDMVRMSNPGGIRMHARIDPALPPVTVDVGQMTQTLLNICLNACDAMPHGGILTLAAAAEHLPEPRTLAGQDLAPGPYCVITVSDTGAGIPGDILERIFEPFFTTKEKGKGTGLGLSVALGIVQSHHGALEVRSRQGHGTQFLIYLPSETTMAADTGSTAAVAAPPRPSHTLLVVDDDLDYLDMMEDALEAEGYRALFAHGGSAALELFRAHHKEIHAVLLDMIMPEMGGSRTFETLRALDPQACVILCSGFSVEGKATQLLDHGAAAFLQKPFSMDELRRCLAAVLSDGH